MEGGALSTVQSTRRRGVPSTSVFRGVSWHAQSKKYKAQIKVRGKDFNLGRFLNEREAAVAYDYAAINTRGRGKAITNFPLTDYPEAELEQVEGMKTVDLAIRLRRTREREATQTSKFCGVRLNRKSKKWESYVRLNSKHLHLGCYISEICAAKAHDCASIHIMRNSTTLVQNTALGGRPRKFLNFRIEDYEREMESLITLPVKDMVKLLKKMCNKSGWEWPPVAESRQQEAAAVATSCTSMTPSPDFFHPFALPCVQRLALWHLAAKMASDSFVKRHTR